MAGEPTRDGKSRPVDTGEDVTATESGDEWRSCPECSAEASICGCDDATATEVERPWLLRLICCGRDDGIWPCATWDEADEIRRSYVEAEGHDRSAIITTRLGYLRGGSSGFGDVIEEATDG